MIWARRKIRRPALGGPSYFKLMLESVFGRAHFGLLVGLLNWGRHGHLTLDFILASGLSGLPFFGFGVGARGSFC